MIMVGQSQYEIHIFLALMLVLGGPKEETLNCWSYLKTTTTKSTEACLFQHIFQDILYLLERMTLNVRCSSIYKTQTHTHTITIGHNINLYSNTRQLLLLMVYLKKHLVLHLSKYSKWSQRIHLKISPVLVYI